MVNVYMFYGMMALLAGVGLYGLVVAVDIWMRRASLKRILRDKE